MRLCDYDDSIGSLVSFVWLISHLTNCIICCTLGVGSTSSINCLLFPVFNIKNESSVRLSQIVASIIAVISQWI